jgi:hypothetical protein
VNLPASGPRAEKNPIRQLYAHQKRDDFSEGHSREDAEKRPMSPQNKPFDRLAFVYDAANDVAERINSKIMSIKRRAGGYRNIENFKTAVLFYCGGLDLDPR